jgi:tripartite-type tricarboxylate transporter receptor subunit TctC
MARWRGLIALLAVVIPLAAEAQEWSELSASLHRAVPRRRLATDVAACLIGEHLSRTLGQQIVVGKTSGASGVVGAEFAAKARRTATPS